MENPMIVAEFSNIAGLGYTNPSLLLEEVDSDKDDSLTFEELAAAVEKAGGFVGE